MNSRLLHTLRGQPFSLGSVAFGSLVFGALPFRAFPFGALLIRRESLSLCLLRCEPIAFSLFRRRDAGSFEPLGVRDSSLFLSFGFRDPQFRMLGLQPLQQVGQADQREAFAQAQPQQALQRIAAAEARDHRGGVLQQAAGVVDEGVPFRGQADARPVADEQLGPEGGLKLPDALRRATARGGALRGVGRAA